MDTAYLHLLLSIAKRYLETLWSAATAETLFSIFRGPIHSLDELEAFAGALLRFLIRGGDDGNAAAGAQGGLLGLCAELAVAGVDDDEQSWAAEPARVNDAESRWEDDRTALYAESLLESFAENLDGVSTGRVPIRGRPAGLRLLESSAGRAVDAGAVDKIK